MTKMIAHFKHLWCVALKSHVTTKWSGHWLKCFPLFCQKHPTDKRCVWVFWTKWCCYKGHRFHWILFSYLFKFEWSAQCVTYLGKCFFMPVFFLTNTQEIRGLNSITNLVAIGKNYISILHLILTYLCALTTAKGRFKINHINSMSRM